MKNTTNDNVKGRINNMCTNSEKSDMMFPEKIILNDVTFTNRILGMMVDYEASMGEALLWDYESFGYKVSHIYKSFGEAGIENSFRAYLSQNGVTDSVDFYTDIFMGRDDDRVLRKMKSAKSKNKPIRAPKGNVNRT